MEVAMEVEDDLFFDDLSKRIALLITDDEDDLAAVRCPTVSLQAFSQVCRPVAPLPLLYDQNCRREVKGTGVFIPRSSLPRRKNRQGRFGSHNSTSTTNTKSYRQHEKSRVGVSNNVVISTNYSDNHSCNCYYNSTKMY